MRNDVKQNVEGVEQQRVAKPRRVLALAMMFGMFGVGAGQLASASEMAFASDLATASSKQRAVKPVDTDTGPWPLCSGATNSKALDDGEQVLGLYPMGDGTYLLHTVDALDAKSCVKSTTSGLGFQFEGSSALAVIADSDPTGSPIVYDFSVQPAELKARVIEPVLCHSYYSGSAGLALELTDSNGVVQLLPGLETVNYQLNSGVVAPIFAQAAHGPVARCHVFPYGATPTDPPPIPGVNADLVFAAGFEDGGDLEVTLLDAVRLDGDGKPVPISLVSAVVGTDFTYKVRVRNLGEEPATNIHVREFLPTGAEPIHGLAVDAVECEAVVIRAADPSEPEPLDCEAPNATGLLASFSGTLLPYDSIELTLTRKVPAGDVDKFAFSAVAAFSNPAVSGDANLGNNSRPLLVQVIDKIKVDYSIETNGDSGGDGGTLVASVTTGNGCGDASASPIMCDPDPAPVLAFSAVAGPGYTFAGFKTAGNSCPGAPDTDNDYESGRFETDELTSACSVIAKFHSKPTVSVHAEGQGTVTLDPSSGNVHYGESVQLTVVPNQQGWELADALTGDTCTPEDNQDGTWTVSNLERDCVVSVNFTESVYRVDMVVSGNGSVFSPPAPYLDVGWGDPASFILLAGDGFNWVASYEDNCGADGQQIGVLSELSPLEGKRRYEYFVYPVEADCTVAVEFDVIQYSVTGVAEGNGRIHFSELDQDIDSILVDHEGSVGFWLTPDEGHHVYGNPEANPPLACGGIALEGNPHVTHGTVGSVTAEGCVVSAVFAINKYDVTVKLGAGEDGVNGTIGPVGGPLGSSDVELSVDHGDTVDFEVLPGDGRHAEVIGCGFPQTSSSNVFTSGSIGSGCTATVTFPLNVYEVTITNDGNGDLSPGLPNSINVQHGDLLNFGPVPASPSYSFDLDATKQHALTTCENLEAVNAPWVYGIPKPPGVVADCNIHMVFQQVP